MSAPSVVQERPVLSFDRYGIAVHMIAERPEADASRLPDPAERLDSFEQDLLAYAYRIDPPFRTTLVEPKFDEVTAHFPAELDYVAEGRRVRLECPTADESSHRHRFRVRAARTDFVRSRLSVLHVVLSPHPDGRAINEYELIKMIKIWEGGEGLPGPGQLQPWLRFDTPGGLVPFKGLADQIVGPNVLRTYEAEGGELTYRVGTVQIMTGPSPDGLPSLLDEAVGVCENPNDYEALRAGGDIRWRRIAALGGVVQGLLDFRAIDAIELSDVLSQVNPEPDSILGFHKGTLTSISPADRPWAATKDFLGISPYLLITHGVILHNEERLKEALREPAGGRVATSLRRAQEFRRHIATILDAHVLPNVFHYPAERELYERAHDARGLNDLEQEGRKKLDELTLEIEDEQNTRRNVAGAILTVSLALVAAAQSGRAVPVEVSIVVIVTVGLAAALSSAWRWR